MPGVDLCEHVPQLGLAQARIGVGPHQVLPAEARGLGPLLLLQSGIAQHQHGHREHIRVQVQEPDHAFPVLEDVADVAGAQPQRLCGHHRVLGRDQGILAGQDQVAGFRVPAFLAGVPEAVQPTPRIREEHQHHRGRRDERLVVAADGQLVLHGLVPDIQDGVQGLVAGGRGLYGRVQDQVPVCLGNRPVQEGPHRFPVEQRLHYGVHGASSGT